MRLVHDEQLCASLGMCEAVAPDVFEIGADGALRVLQPEPSAGLRARAEAACAACPTGALRVED
jgi:ferredoxin